MRPDNGATLSVVDGDTPPAIRMTDLQHPSHGGASGLAGRIARLGLAGVGVLLASVALAVGGPLLDLPGVQADARAWALASAALGGVSMLLVLQALTQRQRGVRSAADPALLPALLRAQAQLHALALAVPQGVALTRERRFEWANPTFCGQLGWASGELLGRSPYELFRSVNADDSLGAAVRTAFAAGQPYAGELQFRRRDGSCFLGRLQARQVDPAEPAAGTLWQLDALTALDAPEAPGLAATHDPLTRLLNRPAFEAALAAWLVQAPAGQPAALLHLDLDRFKRINDAVGRDAGDALLRDVAGVLQAHVRACDAVARLDGDTYALLLPGCVAAVAVQLGQRLRGELAALGVSHQGQRLGVAATVGVAEVIRREPGAGTATATATATASDWLARGHAAWYVAKYGGHGAVRLAAPASSLALVLPA